MSTATTTTEPIPIDWAYERGVDIVCPGVHCRERATVTPAREGTPSISAAEFLPGPYPVHGNHRWFRVSCRRCGNKLFRTHDQRIHLGGRRTMVEPYPEPSPPKG